MKKTIVYLSILLILALCVTACSDSDEYVDKFTNGEEIRYAGRANDPLINPGHDRLELKYVLSTDPNLVKTVIYWNAKKDSVVLNYKREELKSDTVSYVFEDMPENSYSFEIVNYDKFNNVSVPQFVTGQTFGKRYLLSLNERMPDKLIQQTESGESLVVQFRDSIMSSVGVAMEYYNREGELIRDTLKNSYYELGVLVQLNTHEFKNLDTNKTIKYRTLHKPTSNAIDVFYNDFKEFKFEVRYQYDEEVELDKSKFAPLVLDNDSPLHADGNIQWEYLWDGQWAKHQHEWYNETNWCLFSTEEKRSGRTVWFTVDVGEKARISKYRTNFYWPYQGTCPKEYELWGYAGEGLPPQNGEWTSDWIKLATISNTASNDDTVYATGDIVTFPDNKHDGKEYRYYRIHCLANWGNSEIPNIGLGEITFWQWIATGQAWTLVLLDNK